MEKLFDSGIRLKFSALVLLLFGTFLFSSCSRKVLVGIDSSKLSADYIVLRKNGDYQKRYMALYLIRTGKIETGRYVFSNDTVYFLNTYAKGIYTSNEWAVIDTVGKKFIYYPAKDSLPVDYYIEKIDYRLLYRSKSQTVR